jgi:hypothetical protein
MHKEPLQTIFEILHHVNKEHPSLVKQFFNSSSHSDIDILNSEIKEWALRSFSAPSPKHVKQQVMLRNNLINATWIETGTFYGDTSYFLSQHSKFVHTTEPEPKLFASARKRFENLHNICVYNDLSEIFLPKLLPTLSGNLCFWLDGHYSAGNTFAGPNDTPLRDELTAIAANIFRFDNVAILIDDIRLCGSHHIFGSYPTLDELVYFATKLNLKWYIEHDIFIAKS